MNTPDAHPNPAACAAFADRANPAERDTDARADVFKIENLTMAYDDYVVMQELNFTVKKGEIFFIMGGSGCGKSTLLRHMIGLLEPAKGAIYYRGENFTDATALRRQQILRQFLYLT